MNIEQILEYIITSNKGKTVGELREAVNLYGKTHDLSMNDFRKLKRAFYDTLKKACQKNSTLIRRVTDSYEINLNEVF